MNEILYKPKYRLVFKDNKLLLFNMSGKFPMRFFYFTLLSVNGLIIYYSAKKVWNFK
jgi:hypothetical protein